MAQNKQELVVFATHIPQELHERLRQHVEANDTKFQAIARRALERCLAE